MTNLPRHMRSVVLGAALALSAPVSAWAAVTTDNYQSMTQFNNMLAKMESGSTPTKANLAVYSNASTATGKYGCTAACAAESLYKPDPNNPDRKGAGEWNGTWADNPFGVKSRADYMKSEAAQDYVQAKFTEKNWGYIKDSPAVQEHLGKEWKNGLVLNEGAVLAAAHLLGQGGLKKYLATGELDPADAARHNMTMEQWEARVMQYMKNGSECDVSAVTGHDGVAVDNSKVETGDVDTGPLLACSLDVAGIMVEGANDYVNAQVALASGKPQSSIAKGNGRPAGQASASAVSMNNANAASAGQVPTVASGGPTPGGVATPAGLSQFRQDQAQRAAEGKPGGTGVASPYMAQVSGASGGTGGAASTSYSNLAPRTATPSDPAGTTATLSSAVAGALDGARGTVDNMNGVFSDVQQGVHEGVGSVTATLNDAAGTLSEGIGDALDGLQDQMGTDFDLGFGYDQMGQSFSGLSCLENLFKGGFSLDSLFSFPTFDDILNAIKNFVCGEVNKVVAKSMQPMTSAMREAATQINGSLGGFEPIKGMGKFSLGRVNLGTNHSADSSDGVLDRFNIGGTRSPYAGSDAISTGLSRLFGGDRGGIQ